jgi:hypothetical protein
MALNTESLEAVEYLAASLPAPYADALREAVSAAEVLVAMGLDPADEFRKLVGAITTRVAQGVIDAG